MNVTIHSAEEADGTTSCDCWAQPICGHADEFRRILLGNGNRKTLMAFEHLAYRWARVCQFRKIVTGGGVWGFTLIRTRKRWPSAVTSYGWRQSRRTKLPINSG